MRRKIWANPEPNEGLIRAVKICQLLVNSASGPALGGGEALRAGAFGPVPRVLFFSLFLVFSFFWNVNINFMEGPGLCSHWVLIAHS